MGKVKDIGEVYECDVCGNIVKVKKIGVGKLGCFKKPKTQLKIK